jgi:hypothetical protein
MTIRVVPSSGTGTHTTVSMRFGKSPRGTILPGANSGGVKSGSGNG